MKQFLREKNIQIKVVIYCFIVSLIILLLTSKCSLFYPFNDWVDANAFFTVGKGMMHGRVPYLDIFEQKGPLLYLIYGLGYLISNTSFLGIFLIEIICWTITLYYCYKIGILFLSKANILIIIPLFMSLVCTSVAFAHGGSAEELCLPLFSVTLYYFISNFKEKQISRKRLFIAGFSAGCIFLVKYTLLGFWFGFMLGILLYFLNAKNYKQALMSCTYFLLGMLIPILITFIYLGFNQALKSFFEVYFKINITAYKKVAPNMIIRFLKVFGYFYIACYRNRLVGLILLALFPLFILKSSEQKNLKKQLLLLYLLTILGIFYGLKLYKYYLFPIFIFGYLSLVLMMQFIKEKFSIVSINNKLGIILSLVIATSIGVWGANYKDMRFMKKDELFQYKFASIIKKEEHPTLVNMGFLDCGLFTLTNIVPTTYYFEHQNIPYENYPYIIQSFNNYIENKETMFIVYYTRDSEARLQKKKANLFQNYELIEKANQKFEQSEFNAYLFRRKTLIIESDS